MTKQLSNDCNSFMINMVRLMCQNIYGKYRPQHKKTVPLHFQNKVGLKPAYSATETS